MSSLDPPLSFFGVELIKYYAKHIHGYLSVTICTIGLIANIINITVFTRKSMISPINVILAALGFVDSIVLLNYYYKAWYWYLRPGSNPYVWWYFSYREAQIMQWQGNIAHIFINTSVWLTVLVSLWRYIAIAYPLKNLVWGTMKTTCKAIVFAFLLTVVLHTPAMIARSILIYHYEEINVTIYMVSFNQTDPLSTYMVNVDHFVYSICSRLTPAILITALSTRLFVAFSKMMENRKKLASEGTANANASKTEAQIARTTLILIVLSIMCLITQLPQCILGLSSYILSVNDHYNYENVLKEFINILELTNSAIGFLIYYKISEQFRQTFKSLFGIKSKLKKSSGPVARSQELVSGPSNQSNQSGSANCSTSNSYVDN